MNTTDVLPVIAIRSDDHAKLSALVSAHGCEPDVARTLAAELARAKVMEPDQIGADVVTMNATVEFRDEATGRTRRVTLVYPKDADILKGKVSVLTPVGAALIGLAAGDSIEWETRDGQWRTLTLVRVLSQSPAAAE